MSSLTELREIARPLSEWTEEDGDVLWWKFPIEEPPYVGTPLDQGFEVAVLTMVAAYRTTVPLEIRGSRYFGGWPGYHTHWTPLPPTPVLRALESQEQAGG